MAKLSKEQKKNLSEIGIDNVKTVEEGEKRMKEFLAKEGIEDLEEDFDDLYEMASIMYPDSEKQSDDLVDEIEDELEEELEDELEDELEEELEEELEDEDKEETKKPSKKKSKKAPVKKAKKKSTKRLNPKENEEDAAKYDDLIQAVKDIDEKSSFQFNFIANGGLTVKFAGNNSKKVLFSFDSPKVRDEEIIARVYFPSIKDESKLVEIFGEDYEMKPDWSTNILVHDVKIEDFVSIINDSNEEMLNILNSLGKKDERLGKNRKKMEDDLKESRTQKAEAAKKKVANKKKVASKKAPAKKAPAKKTVAKKSATKKAATKRKATKKAPAKKVAAKGSRKKGTAKVSKKS